MKPYTIFLVIIIILQIPGYSNSQIPMNNVPPGEAISYNVSSQSLTFTENRGQFKDITLFKAETGGTALYFCRDEVAYLFSRDTDELIADDLDWFDDPDGFMKKHRTPRYKKEGILIKARFLNANPEVEITGGDRLSYNYNYFRGNDRANWHTNVPNYSSITYNEIYSGIDLVYYGDGHSLKYDFIVQPGADISQIRISYDGVEDLSVSRDGALEAQTPFGPVYEKTPYIYQEIDGVKQAVSGRYELLEPGVFGFAVDDDYNRSYPLVIDPELVFSSYLGGAGSDFPHNMTIDSNGDLYIIGWTGSVNMPLVNPYQESYQNIYFAKIEGSGESILYGTYFGGTTGSTWGYDIAVDDNGNIYFVGVTSASDFPLENPLDNTYNGGDDAFISILSAWGDSLIFSTYLGGTYEDIARTVALDQEGAICVAGYTRSPDFPLLNGYDESYEGADAFITKLSPFGNSMIFSTFLGGSLGEIIFSVAINNSNELYVAGATHSTDFPMVNAFDNSHNGFGHYDVFVAILPPDGSSLLYSTYLGGSGDEVCYSLALDDYENIYLTGFTRSANFPTANPYDNTINGGADIFITKFSPDGQSLLYSTYLGGSDTDDGYGIATDNLGNALILGWTESDNFPTVNAYDVSYNGSKDMMLVKVSTIDRCLLFSTYLGGSGEDYGQSIVLDSDDYPYIFGMSSSPDFPTVNGFNPTHNGYQDYVIAKFNLDDITLEYGSIVGTVADYGANPIEGVLVSLPDIDLEIFTNSNGEYSLESMCAGRYVISFSHPDFYDTVITDIMVDPGQDTHLDVILQTAGAISGAVTGADLEPIDEVIVSVLTTGFVDTTDILGGFFMEGLLPGTYDISFARRHYQDTILTAVQVIPGDTVIFDVQLVALPQEVTLWYGNPDGTPIPAAIGERLYVDVYIQMADSVDLYAIVVPLGSADMYIEDHHSETGGEAYPPVDSWGVSAFYGPEVSPPYAPGWSGEYYIGVVWDEDDLPLHYETPTRIVTFALQTVNDPNLIGDTVSCFAQGYSPFGDPPGTWIPGVLAVDFPERFCYVYEYFSPVYFTLPGACDYIIGDFNGSGTFNIADIIAAFSKLKTGSPDATLLCECPPESGDEWSVAMDLNNSCGFNVADVIAGFSKLKTGSPDLISCELCPPTGGSPAPGEDDQPTVLPRLKSKMKGDIYGRSD